ncbi:hypothetical protein HDV01_000887 [Terramyces sp. JEL0728]|nr:hypothetical protein HDV01_000887 [Terramyces sp. JEL0728]
MARRLLGESHFASGLLQLLAVILQVFLIPSILQQLLLHLSGETTIIDNGYLLALGLFVSKLISTVIASLNDSTKRIIRTRVVSLLTMAIYKKSFNLSPTSKKEYPNGRLLTMINIDVSHIARGLVDSHNFWSIPLQIVFSVYLLYKLIGNAVWVGLAVIICAILATASTGPIFNKIYGEMLKLMDSKITLLRETLIGIRLVKYMGIESVLENQIKHFRDMEYKLLVRIIAFLVAAQGVSNLTPFLMPVIVFSVYIASTNLSLTPQVVFPAMTLFYALDAPLATAREMAQSMTTAYVATKRILKFMDAEDKPNSEKGSDNHALEFENSSFRHEDGFQLKNISLKIPKGSLVAVVGNVGSGKSSFLSAILGNMIQTDGSTFINGSIAYCQQQPWIQSCSIQQNILFGKDLDNERIKRVVNDCEMIDDLQMFADGIKTEIGENGISLSGMNRLMVGGQKSRLALARALYAEADIYLLDDPLASLDAKVGRAVFHNALKKHLESKTVIMSTHKLELLNSVDQILLLDNGCVVGYGTFDELKESSKVFQKLVENHKFDEQPVHKVAENKELDDSVEEGSEFFDKEERNTGSTPASVYLDFIKLFGFKFAFLYVMGTIAYAGFNIWQNIVLSKAADDTSGSTDSFLKSYILLGVLQAVSYFIMELAIIGAIKLSNKLHHMALGGVMNSPVAFFDSNPVGRIINRFSSDMTSLDWEIPTLIEDITYQLVSIVSSIVLIAQANPPILLLMLFIGLLDFLIFSFYQKSNIELKRLISIRKSPLDSHTSESISGLETINAFRLQQHFARQHMQIMDKCLAADFLFQSVSLWVNLRMNALTLLITLCISMAVVFYQTPGGIAGLSITSALNLSGIFQFMVLLGEMEAEFNSFERLNHYAKNLDQEPLFDLPSDPISGIWPVLGEIEFRNVDVRYPSKPEYSVIKNLSVVINPGEKVGVCGRTGSGKSTLVSSLFRMADIYAGHIIIDGHDISKLGLHTLRSRLQIIPQDPTLFSGTLRHNLDMLNRYTDQEIWDALALVGMKDYIATQNETLQMEIANGGGNMSVGQRQLLCLARSILAKPKILVVDEATAAVDIETEQLIQNILLNEFRDSTVISIAHRISSIAAFDRIIVLDQGRLLENDTPRNLLSRESSFAELVSSSGPTNEAFIREMVFKK